MSSFPSEDELRIARADAVDLNLEASDLESVARKARAKADAAQKHYEDMLAIAYGQFEINYKEKA